MRLYDYGPSQNCFKVRLLAAHFELALEVVPVSIFEGHAATPEFLAENPMGTVPLLQTDSGECLPESNAILAYLAEGTAYLPHEGGTDVRPHLAVITALLRSGINHDFSGYKENTLIRRIQRRMQVLHIEDVPTYVERLESDRGELQALFDELLIGVTQFFRDPDAFETLKSCVLLPLIAAKPAGEPMVAYRDTSRLGHDVRPEAGPARDEAALPRRKTSCAQPRRSCKPPRISLRPTSRT